MDSEREMERENERKAAWAALRCAASVGQAHRFLSLLIGNAGVTSLKVGATIDPPEFAALDLVGSYVIGERKRIYKSRSCCRLGAIQVLRNGFFLEIRHTPTPYCST